MYRTLTVPSVIACHLPAFRGLVTTSAVATRRRRHPDAAGVTGAQALAGPGPCGYGLPRPPSGETSAASALDAGAPVSTGRGDRRRRSAARLARDPPVL